MSRYTRDRLIHMSQLLRKAASLLPKAAMEQNERSVLDFLEDCQEGAIALGSQIEKDYGMGTETVAQLEKYCESLYQIHESLSDPGLLKEHLKRADDQLKEARTAFERDCPERLEVVFFPYKASMWDSLESIWMAADADPNCDAYVVPIPYYEKKPDGSFSVKHYEGKLFPDYVPIVSYKKYFLEERRPDIVYIHNPYDAENFVTSVAEAYYSNNIKRYTDCLIYVPYYATSGTMSEVRALCTSYFHVDYIVIQAEKYLNFFHPVIPQEKFLILGSPKYDRVIRMCENPPEPPEDWRERLSGKKVYFYNTSLSGMLARTDRFFDKMRYVFQMFEGREDACLLWRPHPLLESTLDSMRPQHRVEYDRLKNYFVQNELGILDETPDVTASIAHSDAYVGERGSSLSSMFGIAGKPLFLLNLGIHRLPEEEDWRGEIIRGIERGNEDWLVTQGSKLFHAPAHDFHYQYVCDLCEYAEEYYLHPIEIDGTVYVCPGNAQDIAVVRDGTVRHVALEKHEERRGAFMGACRYENYIYLLPLKYPLVVRYDTKTDELMYLDVAKEIFVPESNGEQKVGGSAVWRDYVVLSSPVEDSVMLIHAVTMEVEVRHTGAEGLCGSREIVPDGDELWLLPYDGDHIIRWNPGTGERRDYRGFPEGFFCTNPDQEFQSMQQPLSWAVRSGDRVVFSPYWGNMYLELDRESWEITEWKLPFQLPRDSGGGYHPAWPVGTFIKEYRKGGRRVCLLFTCADSRLYEIGIDDGAYRELPVEFDLEELRAHEPGFARQSQWMQYGCMENSFNSLKDFLDDRITGGQHDRGLQLQAFGANAANSDGTCGEKIHRFAYQRVTDSR